MSLTVSRLMELPSLRRAKVLGGRGGLDRIVSSISVLEYSSTTDTQKKLFESIEFQGSEIVITAFSNVADDVEAQCANIRSMSEVGEVGMILYYVGIIMPSVDQRLVKLADELDFVLICMPENEPDLRYSEVITEVMDAIIRDELDNPAFALDMLDRIAKLPHNQQTVKTIMRIASDRLRASVVITDAEYGILSEATWPRTETLGQEEVLSYIKDCSGGESFKETRRKGRPSWIYRAEIHTGDDSLMHLLAISEGGRIDPMLWKQAVEGVRLSMGVWGKDHGKVNLSELIRAIIQDEPIKMRRLGALYRIDVEAMSDVWIMKNMGVNNPEIWVEPLKKLSSHFVSVELCGLYDDDILIFPVGERTLRDMNDWAEALVEFFHEKNLNFRVTRCPMLQKTSAAKYAYEMNSAYLTDAMTIFPRRDYFTLSEIEFAGECRRIADAGKESAAECMSMLQPLIERRDGEEIIHTLQAYILDENSSTTRAAEALFVHKNTVKYRLQKAGDLLGFHIGDILQSRNLAYALAMQRMLGPA